MLFTYPKLMYSPDGDGGDAGKAGNGDLSIAKLIESFNNLANKQGGQDAAGVLLLQEAKEYRAEIKQLKAELEAARDKVPADGSTVLTADETAVWQAYKELGKPEELKTQLGEYSTLQRQELFRQAAEAHGYKPGVLGQLPGAAELAFEFREVEADGQKNKVAFVKNGDGQERPLPEYAQEKWADFMPALVAEQGNVTQQQFTKFPRQAVGGKAPKQDAIGDTLNKKYAPRNTMAQEK